MSRYLTALEKQAEWIQYSDRVMDLDYWKTVNFEWGPDVLTPVRKGDVYYVSPEFCELLVKGVGNMPDLVLDESWYQTETGFIYFDGDLPLPGLPENLFKNLPKTYILEHPEGGTLDNNLVGAGWYRGKDGRMILVEYVGVPRFPNLKFTPVGWFRWPAGDRLSYLFKDPTKKFSYDPLDAVSSEEHAISGLKYIGLLLQLMSQKILTPRAYGIPRGHRRRAEREFGSRADVDLKEAIQVITLRRYSERTEKSEESEERDWQWRWMVGGHWRNQWYPSIGMHKPVFIWPYIKGPEDKPFKEQKRIYNVTR